MSEEGISGTVEKTVPAVKHQDALRLYAEGHVREAMTLLGVELCREETAKGWNDWAVMQGASNFHREAEEGYRRALTLDARYVAAAANLGLLLSEQDRVEEALPFLEFASQERAGKLEREYRAALKTCRAKKETLPKQPDRETQRAAARNARAEGLRSKGFRGDSWTKLGSTARVFTACITARTKLKMNVTAESPKRALFPIPGDLYGRRLSLGCCSGRSRGMSICEGGRGGNLGK